VFAEVDKVIRFKVVGEAPREEEEEEVVCD